MIDILIPKFDPANPHSAVENMAILARDALCVRKTFPPNYLAFLHDDVLMEERTWYVSVEEFFRDHHECGMLGFGGAMGLGTDELYKRPYDYKQLARIDFISNMSDAEAHGRRVTTPTRVSVLDGFCQIIRREAYEDVGGWQSVLDLEIEFHMYDAAMACLMKEKGWEVWMLPIPCTHLGGRTSTTPEYDAWLRSRGIDGDLEIHQKAHKVIYDRFRNVLPLRVR